MKLVDPMTDTHLWAESYDRETTEMLEVQADIAARIAAAIGPRMRSERPTPLGASSVNPQAHDYFLRARQMYNTSGDDPLNNDSACALARKALDAGPEWGLAHSLYGAVLFKRYNRGEGSEWLDSAFAHVRLAISLDPDFPASHHALAFLYGSRRWHKRALQHAEEAVRLDPNYTPGLQNVGNLNFAATGRLDDALAAQLRVEQIPSSQRVEPGVIHRYERVSQMLLLLEELAGADRWARKSIELQPTHADGYRALARVRLGVVLVAV